MLARANSIYLLTQIRYNFFQKLLYDINSINSLRSNISRLLRHIACNAYIANSVGIYIAAECPQGHSAKGICFFYSDLILPLDTSSTILVSPCHITSISNDSATNLKGTSVRLFTTSALTSSSYSSSFMYAFVVPV